jgi:chloramphenicol 3-O phosphotransferase
MPHPNVILLNGSSSAGKTSIARAMQAQLPGLWMHVGVDHFVPMAPAKFLGVPEGLQMVPQANGALPIRIGPVGYHVIESFHRAVRAIAAGDVPVIVDDVILEPRLMRHWLRTLDGLDVFFVGVHCVREELERREVARGDRGRGQARAQFDLVHTHGAYDFTVDTTSTSPDACAREIVTALAGREKPSAFEILGAMPDA